jgi:ankyrin repeat protein
MCVLLLDGNEEWLDLLLSKGANINAMTNDGLTPLKIAIENGNKDFEKLLRKRGAKEITVFMIAEQDLVKQDSNQERYEQ